MRRARVLRRTLRPGLLGALLPALAGAQGGATVGDEPRPIALAEAIQLAQRNAPAVVQAHGSERTAGAARRAAVSAYLPSLNLNASSGRTQGVQFFQGQLIPLTGNPWNYNNGLNTQLELFDGGRRWQEVARARAQAEQADAAVVQARFGPRCR